MTGRILTPEPKHHAFRDEAIALLTKHGGHLSAEEMLALTAHLVGQTIALQDQRTMTRDRAMEIVVRNIEVGNQEVLSKFGATVGSA